MPYEKEREALLAKGRRLFDSCVTDDEYACVIGYIGHNLAQGGWRAEAIAEFIVWLQRQDDDDAPRSESAATILRRLEEDRLTGR
jgi:hypothetical protein